MSEESLDANREALEQEFFQGSADAAAPEDVVRSELHKASGMNDPALLDQLAALGLTGKTVAALSLVPLVWVAWADGVIQDNERTSIMHAAHAKGLEEGTPGYALLDGWLKKQPDDKLFAAWETYIRTLKAQLNHEQVRILRTTILNFARVVAESAGGFLGIGRVSASEDKVLARIGAALEH